MARNQMQVLFGRNEQATEMNESSQTSRESAKPQAVGRNGEAMLAATIDHLAAGIFVCDAKWPDFPIVYISYGFTVITGYNAEETLGRSPRFLPGEASPLLVDAIERAMAGGRTFRGDVLCRRRD